MSSARYEEVAAMVKEMTYKPGWTIWVDQPSAFTSYPMIEITAFYYAPDTWSEEPKRAMVYARQMVPPYLPLEELPRWVFDHVICNLEQHEAAEHFRWRGEWVQPPHPKPGESWPF